MNDQDRMLNDQDKKQDESCEGYGHFNQSVREQYTRNYFRYLPQSQP